MKRILKHETSSIIKKFKMKHSPIAQVTVWSENTYLSGYAKTRWPKVTKLVSWLDINHASDETLQYQFATHVKKVIKDKTYDHTK